MRIVHFLLKADLSVIGFFLLLEVEYTVVTVVINFVYK